MSKLRAAAALAFLLPAADAAPARGGVWEVACGLPQQTDENDLLRNIETKGRLGEMVFYTDSFPWEGDGHLMMQMVRRMGPYGVRTEAWVLSRGIGWWLAKAMTLPRGEADRSVEEITTAPQIIESPFLPEPVTVRPHLGEEEPVDGQILALMPDASRLRCADPDSGTAAERVMAAQRALAAFGYDPGPADGIMGPRTRSALRSFQADHGLEAHGQLDDDALEMLVR